MGCRVPWADGGSHRRRESPPLSAVSLWLFSSLLLPMHPRLPWLSRAAPPSAPEAAAAVVVGVAERRDSTPRTFGLKGNDRSFRTRGGRRVRRASDLIWSLCARARTPSPQRHRGILWRWARNLQSSQDLRQAPRRSSSSSSSIFEPHAHARTHPTRHGAANW